PARTRQTSAEAKLKLRAAPGLASVLADTHRVVNDRRIGTVLAGDSARMFPLQTSESLPLLPTVGAAQHGRRTAPSRSQREPDIWRREPDRHRSWCTGGDGPLIVVVRAKDPTVGAEHPADVVANAAQRGRPTWRVHLAVGRSHLPLGGITIEMPATFDVGLLPGPAPVSALVTSRAATVVRPDHQHGVATIHLEREHCAWSGVQLEGAEGLAPVRRQPHGGLGP